MRELKKLFPNTEFGKEGLYNADNRYNNRFMEESNIITGSNELWSYIQNYNHNLFCTGQADFTDAWAVEQAPEGFCGIDDQIFGYIDIPVMGVTLPIYLGASPEHMAKGAVVLGETSIPVGGNSVNSVIAAHRGYRGMAYFRDIERLSEGDIISVTNPWETLYYRVESITIIDPYDNASVKIHEGRDMITLMTCHPYRSHGKYRYLVYCIRQHNVQKANKIENTDEVFSHESDSSSFEITLEIVTRRGGILIIMIVLIMHCQKNNWKKFRKI